MIRFLLAFLAFGWASCVAFGYEKVPSEIKKALGTKTNGSVSTGLVFIDGKFIRPPYRIVRSGNQILVNDIPVTGQLVPWEKFLDTQPPSKIKETEVEVPAEASEKKPSAPSAPAKDGVDPAAPKDGGNKPAEKEDAARLVVQIAPKRLAAAADDLDDFNADADSMKLTDIPEDTKEDKERQKRAEDAKKEEAEEESDAKAPAEASATDANGDEVDPASPEGEAAAKAAAAKAPAAKKTRTVRTLDGRFEENARSRKLLQPIDNYRNILEQTLKSGGFIFFGTDPARRYCKRQKGAFASKDLLKKLPELMSRAKDVESFCDAVRSAGLFSYINQQIAEDLFRHKTDYFELKQRRKALEDEDKLNKMINSHGR